MIDEPKTEGEIMMEAATRRLAEKAEAERNPPAFPCPETDRNYSQPGMELRDWFAGQVVPSFIGGLLRGRRDVGGARGESSRGLQVNLRQTFAIRE